MKILLLGEYSGVHTDLAIALKKKGHQVITAHHGNAFKKFPRDFDLEVTGKYRLVRYWKFFYKHFSLLRMIRRENFDVIQVINPGIFPSPADGPIFHFIFKTKAKKFLLACGDDDVVWDAYRAKIYRYYVFDLQLKYDLAGKKIDWDEPSKRRISKKVRENVQAIIPLCVEYKMAYERIYKKLPFIPLSIDTDKLRFSMEQKKYDEMIIFHGYSKGREGAKGTFLIQEALERIEKKWGSKVKVVYAQALPFDEYKDLLSKATLVIDQPNGYSASMNALYAMFYGCVVFSGSEPEYLESLCVTESPIINILPDADDIYHKVDQILQHEDRIPHIGRKSHEFVIRHHAIATNVDKYLEVWNKY